MTRAQNFSQRLEQMGKTAVYVGLNLSPGQELLITAPTEALPLVRIITKYAYEAGASLVTPFFHDSEIRRARFLYGHEESFDHVSAWLADGIYAAHKEGAARLAITGEDPYLLSGLPADPIMRANRASSLANKKVMDLITDFTVNWSILAYATPAWAQRVFPTENKEVAEQKLWEAIFSASRLNEDNPVHAWRDHNAFLHKKASFLNERRFDALHFKSPYTDLIVGLAEGHNWAGGSELAQNGIICNPNIPTEEIFTTPHRLKVEGYVRSTKPLSYQGNMITDIEVRFKEGAIIEAKASNGQDILERILSTDEASKHLGEVALVDHSSPIAQSNVLFHNTLFDENAASHIALGQAYRKCMLNAEHLSEQQLLDRGANQSLIHIDWMIGAENMNVDAIDSDQNKHPLMRNGCWI